MQRGAEAPILPASPARLPLIVDSHGYAGSPLNDAYLTAMVSLASWGYVTVAPFHGDLRYSVLGPQDARVAAKIHVPIWSEFVAMQALRALSASAALDALLARAEWRDHLDTARIGAFGVSQGGETLMLGGASWPAERVNLDEGHSQVTRSGRVDAVGYVPYFGVEKVPAFGSGQAGATGVLLPFLALSGTSDPIAPDDVVRAALDRMAGPRGHVLLNGQGHDLDPGNGGDILTWTLTFLAAWVDGDAAARGRASAEGRACRRRPRRSQGPLRRSGGRPGPRGRGRHGRVPQRRARSTTSSPPFPRRPPRSTQACRRGGCARAKTFKAMATSGTGPGSEACRFFGTAGARSELRISTRSTPRNARR